ncbi:hypothetical protein [Jeotgalibacillus sp. R-1-5s-1]|uniref:hypothetical protein n=1 Tax=Jeotgalibacillus sp. R-1-5s-1 TaxID=2555897 RepID=UPI00106AA0E9|nr:hypothetical protein [Jeotgalibacillus sp. R-1-5s-1]TFD96263.1 hypothetical protein E2491_11115 [Jeotgalibacillus sp. R-1-5s-1]
MKKVVIETTVSLVFYVLLAIALATTVNGFYEMQQLYAQMEEVTFEEGETYLLGNEFVIDILRLETTFTVYGGTESEPENVLYTFSMLPWGILILFSIPWMIYSYKTRNRALGFSMFASSMTEFADSDERETLITNVATRKAYQSCGYSAPILASVLVIYPLFYDFIPSLPVFMILGVLAIATSVYGIVWVREYRK